MLDLAAAGSPEIGLQELVAAAAGLAIAVMAEATRLQRERLKRRRGEKRTRRGENRRSPGQLVQRPERPPPVE